MVGHLRYTLHWKQMSVQMSDASIILMRTDGIFETLRAQIIMIIRTTAIWMVHVVVHNRHKLKVKQHN